MKKRIVLFLVFFAIARCFAEAQEYILQPGDVISISVVEHPEFSGRHKIRPDGRINYPVIGEIEVATLTPAQLVKIMESKLSSYVNNPVASVSIEQYYANKIYIIGEVNGTGQYEIYEPVDVQKALAMCGGLKNNKVKMIKIIRADGKMVDIPMADFWTGASKTKYILYPGDTLYVPESFSIPWQMITTVMSFISSSVGLVLLITSLGSK